MLLVSHKPQPLAAAGAHSVHKSLPLILLSLHLAIALLLLLLLLLLPLILLLSLRRRLRLPWHSLGCRLLDSSARRLGLRRRWQAAGAEPAVAGSKGRCRRSSSACRRCRCLARVSFRRLPLLLLLSILNIALLLHMLLLLLWRRRVPRRRPCCLCSTACLSFWAAKLPLLLLLSLLPILVCPPQSLLLRPRRGRRPARPAGLLLQQQRYGLQGRLEVGALLGGGQRAPHAPPVHQPICRKLRAGRAGRQGRGRAVGVGPPGGVW